MRRTLVALVLLALAWPARADPVPDAEEAPPGGDFTLMSQRGPVSLQELRGRVVMLYFGYTRCPDVCPTSLAYITQALKGLDTEELAQVQPLLISLDPERDTPERLAEYSAYFHPALLGLTGGEDEVAAVARLYGAKHLRAEVEGSAFGYVINHSAAIYLIEGAQEAEASATPPA